MIKKSLRKLLDFVSRNSLGHMLERMRQADMLRASERYADSRSLMRHEHQVFSQNGEDGAIREIFRRIGKDAGFFIEIGVGAGDENNTTFLLMQGWRGVWIEGSKRNCEAIRKQFGRELQSGQLVLVEALVTAENIEGLLKPYFDSEIDLFSLDIDRNTYYVWQAMELCRPRVSVIEYNAMIPSDMVWKVDYDPARWWAGTSYFGASLAALAELGLQRGDLLVGCDLTGTNAYFVRTDVCGEHFLDPGNVATHYEPSRSYLHGRKAGHPRQYSDHA